MKRVIEKILWIYVSLFYFAAIFCYISKQSIYIYSDIFFTVRSLYIISVIISLIILQKLNKEHKNNSGSDKASVYKKIHNSVIMGVTVILWMFLSLFNDNCFDHYTMIENKNTGQKYIMHQSSVSWSRYLFISKLDHNCLLSQVNKVKLGCDTYASTDSMSWENDNTLILDCSVYSLHNDLSGHRKYTISLDGLRTVKTQEY